MSVRRSIATVLIGAAVVGCQSSRERLNEPTRLPSAVRSYRSAELKSRVCDLPTAWDVSGCVESVPLVLEGLLGDSTAGMTPVRPLIEREFKKVLAANARTVFPDETPRLVLAVTTRTVSIRQKGNVAVCSLSLSVSVFACARGRMKRDFSRDYECRAESPQKDGLVPVCLYEAIQKTARRFVDDMTVAANASGGGHGR